MLCKGLCERIGIEGSRITHKAKGSEWSEETPFPTHTEAFMKVVDMMTTGEGAVVSDKSEIGAIGHRIVQGAEFFTKSEIVTDAIIDKIEEIAPWPRCTTSPTCRACAAPKGIWRPAQRGRVRHHLPPDHAPQSLYVRRAPRDVRKICHPPLRRPRHQPPVREHGRRPVPGQDPSELKMVTCHLGNGSSITAVDGGRCVDTSMGLTRWPAC